MIRALFTVSLVTLALLLTIIFLTAASMGYAETYQQAEDIVYGQAYGVALVLDRFVPTGASNGHAIVDVASGAWHSDRGKIRDHKRAQVYHLMCERGFIVYAIRPGSIEKFSGPEMLDHLNQGIRYVKEQASELQFDAEALGLMGASAGGHLACLAAVTADDSTRVKALAAFFPPTDFLDYGGKKLDTTDTGRISKIVRALAFTDRTGKPTPEQITQAVTAISPARLVTEAAPPCLLIHGDADPLVPLQQSEVMLAALKAKNIPAELIVKPGSGHPWLTLPLEVAVMADWFVKQLVP
jgi:acetyl esterase/lipase